MNYLNFIMKIIFPKWSKVIIFNKCCEVWLCIVRSGVVKFGKEFIFTKWGVVPCGNVLYGLVRKGTLYSFGEVKLSWVWFCSVK